LQAVRDEAHRFAQHYHHLLRRKALFGEKTARKLRKARRTRRGARGKGGWKPPQADGSSKNSRDRSGGSAT